MHVYIRQSSAKCVNRKFGAPLQLLACLLSISMNDRFFIFLLQNNLLARRTGTTDQFARPTNQTGRPGRRAMLFV